jgi:hypothetical protein
MRKLVPTLVSALVFGLPGALAWNGALCEGARADNTSDSVVRKPTPPDELPDYLPGRWKVSLCVSRNPSHAWIRFQNIETGEVRTISRYHLLVGGWFDFKEFRWNYGLTTRTGVYMDREQPLEDKVQQGKCLLLSTVVDDPKIYRGESASGHGLVVNNCVTYTRDAWEFYTGEKYEMPSMHAPSDLLRAVMLRHPEVARRTNVEPAPFRPFKLAALSRLAE